MVTVNVVVLAGTVAADPVERTMPSGDEVTELRLSVPEAGKRLLPLPVAVWHKDVSKRTLKPIAKGDDVLVYGQLVRRFYRSGAGARSLTEVVAAGIKKLEPVPAEWGRPSAGVQIEGPHHEAGARLRPEERGLLRQALAAVDHVADPRRVRGRQQVGGDGLARPHGLLGLHGVVREAERGVGIEDLRVQRRHGGRRAVQLGHA